MMKILEEQQAASQAGLTAVETLIREQQRAHENRFKELEGWKKVDAPGGGRRKKQLCPHCGKYVIHKPDECFELEKNASKRPAGWKSSKTM